MERRRIVVIVGEEPVIDVDVAAQTALGFILGCHCNFPQASIYCEGELLDPAELDAVHKGTTEAAMPAASPAEVAPPLEPALSLRDLKDTTALVGALLERLLNVQIETLSKLSESTRKHFELQLGLDQKFAEECAKQRAQHRHALSEIDIFDRGTKVASLAEEARLRAGGPRTKAPDDRMTSGDLLTGFSTLTSEPRN